MSPAYCQLCGIVRAVQHCSGSATRRLDSPLRSHRPCWPQCHHAYSGLNKSLFASAGPNSLQRGHQQSKTFAVADGLQTKEYKSSLSRIRLGRGHRLDGTSVPKSILQSVTELQMSVVFRLTLFLSVQVILLYQPAFSDALALTQSGAKVLKNAFDQRVQ